jgi:hypothetical protein
VDKKKNNDYIKTIIIIIIKKKKQILDGLGETVCNCIYSFSNSIF